MEHNMPMGLRLSLLHRAFRKRLDEGLQEKGLTGVQFGVLGQLRRLRRAGQEEINQRDLEAATHVTHPTMTEIVKRLEKQGFVVCAPSERDRRFKCIRPTEKAAALHREMDELDERVFREMCRGLTPEQVEAFGTILDQMLNNIYGGCCRKEGGETACD